MADNSIECLHCTKVFDSGISIMKTLDLIRKHVKQDHPTKTQI